MGQYYKIVNPAKRQYLNPSNFGDSLKLQAFGNGAYGTMYALALLLASGNGQGGGDLNSNNPLIGSWAGDPIYVLGDYSDEIVILEGVENPRQYTLNTMVDMKKFKFKDISDKMIKVIGQASPYHPLAVIAHNINNNISSSICRKPDTWGTSMVFIEPEEKHILSFTDLMKVVGAQFGESDEITGDNLAWRLQNLYGIFHTIDPDFKNTHAGSMQMKQFNKSMEIFTLANNYSWNNDGVRQMYDSIGFQGTGKPYVKSVNMVIGNSKTPLTYEFSLNFPCSLMDLKSILSEVLYKCDKQESPTVIGGKHTIQKLSV